MSWGAKLMIAMIVAYAAGVVAVTPLWPVSVLMLGGVGWFVGGWSWDIEMLEADSDELDRRIELDPRLY